MININFSLINDNIKMEDAWRVEVANCGKQRDKDEWNGTRKEGAGEEPRLIVSKVKWTPLLTSKTSTSQPLP